MYVDVPERRANPPEPPAWKQHEAEEACRERATEEFDTNARPFTDWMDGQPTVDEFNAAALEHYRHPKSEDASFAFTKAGDRMRDAYVAWRSEDGEMQAEIEWEMAGSYEDPSDEC